MVMVLHQGMSRDRVVVAGWQVRRTATGFLLALKRSLDRPRFVDKIIPESLCWHPAHIEPRDVPPFSLIAKETNDKVGIDREGGVPDFVFFSGSGEIARFGDVFEVDDGVDLFDVNELHLSSPVCVRSSCPLPVPSPRGRVMRGHCGPLVSGVTSFVHRGRGGSPWPRHDSLRSFSASSPSIEEAREQLIETLDGWIPVHVFKGQNRLPDIDGVSLYDVPTSAEHD
jgi:hypothetical protein